MQTLVPKGAGVFYWGIMTIQVREAGPQDLDQIVRLWKELADFHEALDHRYALSQEAEGEVRNFLASCLKDSNWHFLVALNGDALVGFISGAMRENSPVMAQRRYGYIEDAAVTGSCRRQGIGERLCRELELWFQRQGAEYIGVSAAARNPVSRAFWDKMGYSAASIRMRKEIE